MQVGVRRGPHDQLGALAGGGEARGVAVFYQLLFALLAAGLNLPHGGKDGLLGLIRSQGFEPRLGGQFDIDAESVRQHPQLFYQLRRGAGNGLGMDVAVEAVGLPQKAQCADHQLGGVVRTAVDAGGEEEPLDIVSPVKLNGQVRQFLRSEGCSGRVVAAAVDAVFAVVDAAVGQQNL